MDEPTVFVVDDDEGARLSVVALANSVSFRAESFASAVEFLREFDPARPGCVVTDVRMPGVSGIELQERLAAVGCHIPVIVLTAFAETPLTVQAMKHGAVTLLEKPCADGELLAAIREALARDAARRSTDAVMREVNSRLATLTAEEREVLSMLVDGMPNKLIAKQLEVSLRTVETRRHNIFEKTGTSTVAELVRLVMQSAGPTSS